MGGIMNIKIGDICRDDRDGEVVKILRRLDKHDFSTTYAFMVIVILAANSPTFYPNLNSLVGDITIIYDNGY